MGLNRRPIIHHFFIAQKLDEILDYLKSNIFRQKAKSRCKIKKKERRAEVKMQTFSKIDVETSGALFSLVVLIYVLDTLHTYLVGK